MKKRTLQNCEEQVDRIKRFSTYLQVRGHQESTTRAYLRTAEHFLKWLKKGPESYTAVTKETVQTFLKDHLRVCRCPQAGQRGPKQVRAALNQFLAMEGQERVRRECNTEPPQIEASVQEFDRYLHEVCGLADATRWYHRRHVRAFLRWLYEDRPLSFDEIGPTTLICFVVERAKDYRPGSIGVLAYSLRSYIRFLAFHGKVSPSLATKIPRPPNWSLASLPPTLDTEQLERFWTVFDRTSAIGRRDYAMARCLFDLGLRCCEVADLTLDAIDWHTGSVRLGRTKSRHEDVMPIPESLGRALVDYLKKGRPITYFRAVFVHHRAPRGHTVKGTTVRGAIRRAFSRAGLPWTGTHILRHTMATLMLHNGTSLKEIADVLHHRSLNTTKIYTKLALGELSGVAIPWPRRSL
jgi:site-specific recombinase XerD